MGNFFWGIGQFKKKNMTSRGIGRHLDIGPGLDAGFPHRKGAIRAESSQLPNALRPAAGGRRARADLSACSSEVLDPFSPLGPVAADDGQILIDATIIMLAIVIPTIATRLLDGLALPGLEPEGGISPQLVLFGADRGGRLVDPDPHHHVHRRRDLDRLLPARSVPAARVAHPAHRGAGRLARLEMAVHLSAQGIATVNQLVVPAGTPLHFSITSASVFNVFFVPALGQR